MKMIVGLGNPGKEYVKTRHNVGFMFIDNFAQSLNITIEKEKFNALYNIIDIAQEKVLLLKPCSFINLSGEVIYKFMSYYNIDVKDIFIISDDLDQNIGKYKLKHHGSSGGHNGLKNIELNLKTNEYKRLKIGISNNKLIDTKNYVLGKLSDRDMEIFSELFTTVNDILYDFVTIDFSMVMNKYNRK